MELKQSSPEDRINVSLRKSENKIITRRRPEGPKSKFPVHNIKNSSYWNKRGENYKWFGRFRQFTWCHVENYCGWCVYFKRLTGTWSLTTSTNYYGELGRVCVKESSSWRYENLLSLIRATKQWLVEFIN